MITSPGAGAFLNVFDGVGLGMAGNDVEDATELERPKVSGKAEGCRKLGLGEVLTGVFPP